MATVLVVDDNATNRTVLAATLQAGEHLVLLASNGAEGLGLARVHPPDVVVTDLLMPKMDGWELVRELRADHATAGVPVIIYTAAYAADEVRGMAAQYGVTEVLSKPASLDVVLETVARAARTRSEAAASAAGRASAEREHLALLNDKLLQKVCELERADRERQRLVGLLVRAQEEERARIAVDVHDDTVQVMVAVGMRLELLGRWLADPEAQEQHAKLQQEVRHAIARLRQLMFDLKPAALETEGLAVALHEYLEYHASDIASAFDVEDRMVDEPPGELRELLYRIAQEALANVARHAGATSVHVVLDERDGGYVVRVEDDGAGFDPDALVDAAPDHFGLDLMRQRAELVNGWLHIDSGSGCGTVVEAWVPASARRPEQKR